MLTRCPTPYGGSSSNPSSGELNWFHRAGGRSSAAAKDALSGVSVAGNGFGVLRSGSCWLLVFTGQVITAGDRGGTEGPRAVARAGKLLRNLWTWA